METVKHGYYYDAYDIRKDTTNEPVDYNNMTTKIHFNEDGDYLIYNYGASDGVRHVGIQGITYDETAERIERNECVGSPTTEFSVTNTGGDIFRYTWTTNGTDPEFDEVSTAVGVRVTISDTGLHADNHGEFIIVARGSNYFDVENSNGVVESNKTIGIDGKFILHSVPKMGYLKLKF